MIFTIYKKNTGLVTGVLDAPTLEIARATAPEDCDLLVNVSGEPNVDVVIDGKLVKQNPPDWMIGSQAKAKRNRLLLESDWTDLLSAKERLGVELYNAWQNYRQALRDLPTQPGYPFNIVWPTPPQ
jgi:hypothetical protein